MTGGAALEGQQGPRLCLGCAVATFFGARGCGFPSDWAGFAVNVGRGGAAVFLVPGLVVLVVGAGAAPGVGVLFAGVGDECCFGFPDVDGLGCGGEVEGSVDG